MSLKTKSLIPTVMAVQSNLSPETQRLANAQVINDLTKYSNKKSGVEEPNPNKIISAKPIPKRFKVTLLNTTGAAISGKLFNSPSYTAKDAGITATFDDGFEGKHIDNLINKLNNGNGLMIYGMAISGYDANDVRSDDVIDSLGLNALYYTGKNSAAIPMPIDFAGSERKTDTKDGVVLVKQMIELNFLMQLAYYLDAHCKVSIVFFTEPIQD